ncbi:MAG: hypothetical protein ABI310_07310 [Microbacteriaceae bacterium]
MTFFPRSPGGGAHGSFVPRLERPTAPLTNALRWKMASGGALPAISYPKQSSGNRSEQPNPKRTTFVQGPAAGEAGENGGTQQPTRTVDTRTAGSLRSLTIRELIIELSKAEDEVRSCDSNSMASRKTTRLEQEIIEELHRRRDEFVSDPAQTAPH